MLRATGAWCAGGGGGVASLAGCATTPSATSGSGGPASTPLDGLDAPVSVPLRRGGRFFFLPVAVNGEDAGTWLFDTGSSVSLLERGVARRLGLGVVEQGTARGIGGTQELGWLGPGTVTLGGVAVDLDRLAELNFYDLNRRVEFPLSGILGFDAIAGGGVTLDPGPPTPRLVFHPPGGYAPQPGMREVALTRVRRLPTVEATVPGGGRARLIVDTGQDIELTLPKAAAEAWPEAFPTPTTGGARSVGVGGVASGRHTWVSEIATLGHRWKDVPVKLEENAGLGRIGMGLLRRLVVGFDAPRGRMWVRPVAA